MLQALAKSLRYQIINFVLSKICWYKFKLPEDGQQEHQGPVCSKAD